MKSKIEVRQFAANIAAHVVGVTAADFIGFAKEVEAYVLGGAELPEKEVDETEKMAEMLAKFTHVCKCVAEPVAEEVPAAEEPQEPQEAAVAEPQEAVANEPVAAQEPQAAPVAVEPVYDGQQQA